MSRSNKNISFNGLNPYSPQFLMHNAFALSDNTFIWVSLKWLHRFLSPNRTAFSSKILMCKSDSSSEKCPPVVSLSKNTLQPDLDASLFNKKLQFGNCIELSESSILFIQYNMSISPACETSIFLSKFPLTNLSTKLLSRSGDL